MSGSSYSFLLFLSLPPAGASKSRWDIMIPFLQALNDIFSFSLLFPPKFKHLGLAKAPLTPM